MRSWGERAIEAWAEDGERGVRRCRWGEVVAVVVEFGSGFEGVLEARERILHGAGRVSSEMEERREILRFSPAEEVRVKSGSMLGIEEATQAKIHSEPGVDVALAI